MGGPYPFPEIIRSHLSSCLLVLGREVGGLVRLLKQAQNPFRGRCCLLTDSGLRCPFSDLGCFCHSAGASIQVHTGFVGLEGCRVAVPGTGHQQPWGCDELLLASHRPGGPRGGHAAAPQRPRLGGSSRHPGGEALEDRVVACGPLCPLA